MGWHRAPGDREAARLELRPQVPREVEGEGVHRLVRDVGEGGRGDIQRRGADRGGAIRSRHAQRRHACRRLLQLGERFLHRQRLRLVVAGELGGRLEGAGRRGQGTELGGEILLGRPQLVEEGLVHGRLLSRDKGAARKWRAGIRMTLTTRGVHLACYHCGNWTVPERLELI